MANMMWNVDKGDEMLKGWKHITELREVKSNYSGSYYSAEYAKNNKNMKDMYAGAGISTVVISENVIIKRDSSQGIVYRVEGRNYNEKSKTEFHTQFGTFYSDDQGEFGGELTTPSGENIDENQNENLSLSERIE